MFEKGSAMDHDGQLTVRTEDGITLFHLASHEVFQSFTRGVGALYVQIRFSDELESTTAVIFLAANAEFRVCPTNRKAIRFKKDKYGIYKYLNKEKMQPLDGASREHLRSLIATYLEILDTIHVGNTTHNGDGRDLDV